MNYTQFFTTKTRENGQSFLCLIYNPPIELEDLIRKIHHDWFFGCLPNDWIYETIYYALDELSDNDIDDITIEADVYNHDLWQWLGNSFAEAYCNEYMEEICDCGAGKGIYAIIIAGQWMAKHKIYRAVNDWLEELHKLTRGDD